MTQEALAERLRILRARAGLSLTEAAERTGITRHTIRSLELGRHEARYPTLRKLADGYGVPVEELLEEPVGAEEAEEAETVRGEADAGGDLVTVREFLKARTGTSWIALPDKEWDRWWGGVLREEVVERYEEIEAEWRLLKFEFEALGKSPSMLTRIGDLTAMWGKLWGRVLEARYSVPRKEESDKEFQRRRLQGKRYRTFYESPKPIDPGMEAPLEEEGGDAS